MKELRIGFTGSMVERVHETNPELRQARIVERQK